MRDLVPIAPDYPVFGVYERPHTADAQQTYWHIESEDLAIFASGFLPRGVAGLVEAAPDLMRAVCALIEASGPDGNVQALAEARLQGLAAARRAVSAPLGLPKASRRAA